MSGRANLVLLDSGRADIRFDEGAERLPALLAAGPAAALAHARAARREERLLADVWAEGGAVFALEARRLLFFADALWIGLRHALLAEVGRAWPGWAVAWAPRGVLSLAEAAGLPPDGLVTPSRDLERLERWRPVEIPPHAPAAAASGVAARWRTAALVRTPAGLASYTVLALSALHLAAFGERALAQLPERAVPGLPAPAAGREWDGGSLLYDLPRRTLTLSHQDPLTYHPDFHAWLARTWPGWQVDVHHLGVPEQLARAGLYLK